MCASKLETETYAALSRNDCDLEGCVEEVVITLDVVEWVISFLRCH